MVLDLLLIGIAIALEPFPLSAFVLILGAERGTIKGLAFVLGWLACLVAVIAAVVLATRGNPPAENTVPSDAALAVKLAAGVVLILLAWRQWRQMGRPRQPPAWMARLDRLSLWAAAGLAAFLQPWTLVAAGAATIVDAKLSTAGDYLTLMFYCLLATATYLYLELYAVFSPAAAGNRLQQLRSWLDTHMSQVIIAIFLLLGFWLAGKSIYLLVS
jgi:threonine/homoserine/homoserine lactone efflux protein